MSEKNIQEPEPFVGKDEVQRFLGNVSDNWLYRRTMRDAENPLPVHRFHGKLKFLLSEVAEWARNQ